MTQLLNLLAAIALLVWGTNLVRTGVLRVYGAQLRLLLARSMGNRFTAAAAGMGVTALVQSSNSTTLMLSAFVGQGLVALPIALAALLGADLGGPLIAILLSLDLPAFSPLALVVGVLLFFSRPDTTLGRVGRILIGLGLMLLALKLIGTATTVITSAPDVRALLATLTSVRLVEIIVGAVLALLSSSSLAIVLLAATLAASGAVPLLVALGLVLGASLASGILAVLGTWNAPPEVRQVPMGHLAFKAIGVAAAAPFTGLFASHAPPLVGSPLTTVVL
ncbi:MAG: Na/Pi symporter, partial [Burkholderiales bacterium]